MVTKGPGSSYRWGQSWCWASQEYPDVIDRVSSDDQPQRDVATPRDPDILNERRGVPKADPGYTHVCSWLGHNIPTISFIRHIIMWQYFVGLTDSDYIYIYIYIYIYVCVCVCVYIYIYIYIYIYACVCTYVYVCVFQFVGQLRIWDYRPKHLLVLDTTSLYTKYKEASEALSISCYKHVNILTTIATLVLSTTNLVITFLASYYTIYINPVS